MTKRAQVTVVFLIIQTLSVCSQNIQSISRGTAAGLNAEAIILSGNLKVLPGKGRPFFSFRINDELNSSDAVKAFGSGPVYTQHYAAGVKEICDLCLNNASGHMTCVDAFPAGKSPFGVADMVGNVWQMTGDIYFNGTNYLGVIRGGSYYKPESSWWYSREDRRLLTGPRYY